MINTECCDVDTDVFEDFLIWIDQQYDRVVESKPDDVAKELSQLKRRINRMFTSFLEEHQNENCNKVLSRTWKGPDDERNRNTY